MENKNNIIIWSALILVIIFGFIWISNGRSRNQALPTSLAESGILLASENFFDFEKVSMANGKVNHDFRVKNNGAKPVKITKVYTSCMCTEAILKMPSGREFGPYGMPGHGGFSPVISQTIAPGEEMVVKVIFDPAAHGPAGVGLIERVVYLENNFGRLAELQFKAVVTP